MWNDNGKTTENRYSRYKRQSNLKTKIVTNMVVQWTAQLMSPKEMF
jgi:hypothetical protein